MGTQGEGDGAASGGPDAKKDDIYENRPRHKKIIRVVTVMAYMVSVSFVAIVLSAYYVFLWQPPNPRLMHRSHLRADPQVEYLVHRPQTEVPPTEVPLDETLGGVDVRDKVIDLGDEIKRVRGENFSIGSQRDTFQERSRNLSVARANSISSEDENISNDSPVASTSRNPIVRALLAATATPSTVETAGGSTGVYGSVNFPTKSSSNTSGLEASTLLTAIRGINGSTTRVSSSSTPLTEGGDKSYESVNYFPTTALTGVDIGSGESDRSSNNSSDELGATSERDVGESTSTGEYESLENSTNAEAQQPPLGVEGTTVGTLGTSGRSSPAEIRAETAQPETTPAFAKRRGSGRKFLEFTVRPTKIGSQVARVPTKLPGNETERVEKIPSSLRANEDVPIDIVPGPAEDAGPASESAAYPVPAVFEPESKFMEEERESKEQLAQDGDFGFV